MRPYFLILLTLLWLGSCGEGPAAGEEAQTREHPNIIYILADDLGYGDVGAFHSKATIKTPHLDRLAAEGMRFTDAHTSSAVCTPTRYGILTGRYNWRSPLKRGVLTGASKALIPHDRTTVASLLKKAGYHTAFIGKWHLGWDWALKQGDSLRGEGWNPTDFDNIDFTQEIANGPGTLGFDYSYGHAGSLDMAPYVYVENGKVTAPVDTIIVNTAKYTWWRKGPTAADFEHERVTPNFFDRASNYLKERSGEDDPFFLYLALPSPHTPILPTPEWSGKSGINPYADFVMMIDHYVGDLMRLLKEMGMERNTLVIFTSDNGCSPEADFAILRAGGHDPSAGFRGHKADIFEGGHRVPFLARWPARIRPGSSSGTTICTTDLMATCAALTGMELGADEGEDSFSLVPLFDGQEDAYARETTIHHSINGSFALRKDAYKLIMARGSGGWSDPRPDEPSTSDLPPVQLYDLSSDPAEQVNLYEERPEVVETLERLLITQIQEGRSTPGPPQRNAHRDLAGNPWDPTTSSDSWKRVP